MPFKMQLLLSTTLHGHKQPKTTPVWVRVTKALATGCLYKNVFLVCLQCCLLTILLMCAVYVQLDLFTGKMSTLSLQTENTAICLSFFILRTGEFITAALGTISHAPFIRSPPY